MKKNISTLMVVFLLVMLSALSAQKSFSHQYTVLENAEKIEDIAYAHGILYWMQENSLYLAEYRNGRLESPLLLNNNLLENQRKNGLMTSDGRGIYWLDGGTLSKGWLSEEKWQEGQLVKVRLSGSVDWQFNEDVRSIAVDFFSDGKDNRSDLYWIKDDSLYVSFSLKRNVILKPKKLSDGFALVKDITVYNGVLYWIDEQKIYSGVIRNKKLEQTILGSHAGMRQISYFNNCFFSLDQKQLKLGKMDLTSVVLE